MSDKAEIGYVCYKGGGHFSLAGQSDHGACGSHIGGRIYVEIVGGTRLAATAEEIAEQVREWVTEADILVEAKRWDEYENSGGL